MDKKIGLFWLRDDFRILKNDGLVEATKEHDQVVVFICTKNWLIKIKKLKNGGLVSILKILKKIWAI